MALNLSTLTSPATSGDVLAEALTTADFLESVPVLRNLARGSQKGGDAKQDVALNQPKALPLIKNPAGDLGGYLYIPDVSGNYATGPSVTIGANQTWEGELDMVVTQFGNFIQPMGGGFWTTGFGLLFSSSAGVRVFSKGVGPVDFQPSGITVGTSFNVKYGYDGSVFYADINGVRKFTTVASSQSGTLTETLQLSTQNNLSHSGNYAIQKAKLTVNSAVVFDCDFNGSTSIRHGDTKFQAAVGGPVTLTRAGNDPVTVVKKSVLRFDGVNDFMDGLLNQTVTDGYMFAAFSVLGDGGSEGYGRILGLNSTGSVDSGAGGVAFRRNATTTGLMIRYNENNITTHSDFFDDERGDYLLEAKVLTGSQKSKINNADLVTGSVTGQLNAEEFGIAAITNGGGNRAAIDLEYLALFDASITDAQADAVRNFINNRNTVFDLKDGFGYYFYDAQKAPVGNISSGSASWNGRIVGSDNGDTDKYATQGVSNDQPVSDGYVVTFADNTDHLEIPSTTQAGWQVVGASRGTFVYKVNANAVTELNLLGNAGTVRQAGYLYGIILLPESATERDIQEARSLLIDRGAADGTVSTNIYRHFDGRSDIVDFKYIATSSVTNNANFAWRNCSNMTSFPALDLSHCPSFTNAWQNCSALTSFPEGAKLGTEADNVNFESAWQDSGLTSFSTPLPSATDVGYAWRSCSSLENFSSALPSVTDARYAWRDCSSLTSFSSEIPLVTNAAQTWRNCSSLTSFSAELPLANRVNYAWQGCSSLSDFSADVFANWNPVSINSGAFDEAWTNCTSLTSLSVENILVPIDASGKYATTTGASGGTVLADAGIDIDYDGSGLTAATTAAIDSLSGKGWQVFINGEQIIPNILTLEPAAAYSLRSFDADADPNVVNVRRSSDGATSDFTASEVSDGTLTSWVNTDVDLVTPTVGNGGFEDGLTAWSSSTAILDTSVAYAGNNSARFDIVAGGYQELSKTGILQIGNQYKVTFWAKVSDSSKLTRVDLGSGNLNHVGFSSTDWEYKEVTGVVSGSTSFRFARSSTGDYTVNFDNVTITQLTSDGHVTTWYDQSDNGRDSSQSTASAQPKIVDGGTLVTDSANNPAIIGDGVDDTLFHPTLTNELDSSDFLVTAAYKDDLALGIIGAVPRLYLSNASMAYNTLGTIGYTKQTGRNVMSFQVTGNTQEVFGNGASLGTASETQVDIGQSMFNVLQSGSAFSDGPLMEVVVFGDNQVANRTGIENNINDTYTIY